MGFFTKVDSRCSNFYYYSLSVFMMLPWFHLVLVVTITCALIGVAVFFFSIRSVPPLYQALQDPGTTAEAPLPIWFVLVVYGLSFGIISTGIALVVDWNTVVKHSFFVAFITTLGVYTSSGMLALISMAMSVIVANRIVFALYILAMPVRQEP